MSQYLPDGLVIFERLGYRFGLDWDDSLTIEAPASIDAAHVNAYVATLREELYFAVQLRAHRDRKRCNGGPLHGQRSRWFGYYDNYFRAVRVGRAKWAVYRMDQFPNDRPHFVGYAKSEAKARRGRIYETAQGAAP